MIYLIFFLLGSITSVVGAICGVGGGMVLKPALDAFGILDISSINFLSGCTVFSMSAWNFIQGLTKKQLDVDIKTTGPMALGAAFGGVFGKLMFQQLKAILNNDQAVTGFQMVFMIVITVLTLVYTIKKANIKTFRITNVWMCVIIGMFLGILSSFLGIGGGPFNLMVLGFFFSLPTKKAAQSSLFIILFSQMTSLGQTILTGKVPVNLDLTALVILAISGIVGAVAGKNINKRIDAKKVDILFIGFIIVILGLCVYNLIQVF